MKNLWGPILTGRSTSPITDLLEPSNALTNRVIGFTIIPSIVSFDREFLGNKFKDNLVSTKTLDKTVYTPQWKCEMPCYDLSLLVVTRCHWTPNRFPLQWWPQPFQIDLLLSLEEHGMPLGTSIVHHDVIHNTIVRTKCISFMEFGGVVQPLCNHFC